ncbi:hypothetical protein NEMIN01_2349 [Nematocida minor]|uniref:uncharacterized protein n=1 Tax=Nematocida minor TaxID=1912983 RepID=UPI00221F0D60|nr:uncharacterized protein NEMIN01_2349 [Nematocida minor]KAI5193005.1 hypothetical protein NEMIN01_2349 [Nematocida minor]
MKEVKLKIDVKKIIKACKLIKRADDLLKYDAPKDYADILDRIFSNRIKIQIEGDAEEDEEDSLTKILKSRIYQYFTYNKHGVSAMNKLYTALKSGDKELVTAEAAHVLDHIVQPNTLIYSPKHGIHRQVDKNKPLESVILPNKKVNLRPRAYRLEIDYTDSSSLERILDLAEESVDRERLSYIADLIDSAGMDMNILKQYSAEKEHYTLEKLYTTPHKKTGALLVDYGLKLVHRKHYKIKELLGKIKKMESNLNSRAQIMKEIGKVLTKKELKVAVAIGENIQKIKDEKIAQKSMASAMEYMANSTGLLDRKDGSRVLDITVELLNLKRNNIDGDRSLYNMISEQKNKIVNTITEKNETLKKEKADRDQAKKEGKSEEEIKTLTCSINRLENEIYLLQCDEKGELLQLDNIRDNLYSLPKLSTVQQEHVYKKLEEFGEEINVRVEIVLKLFSIKVTEKRVLKILTALAYTVVVVLVIFVVLSSAILFKILKGDIKFEHTRTVL